jgi:hypothetical protein
VDDRRLPILFSAACALILLAFPGLRSKTWGTHLHANRRYFFRTNKLVTRHLAPCLEAFIRSVLSRSLAGELGRFAED